MSLYPERLKLTDEEMDGKVLSKRAKLIFNNFRFHVDWWWDNRVTPHLKEWEDRGRPIEEAPDVMALIRDGDVYAWNKLAGRIEFPVDTRHHQDYDVTQEVNTDPETKETA